MQYPVALQTHSFISSPSSPEPNTPIPGNNEPKVIKITNCRILRDHKIVSNDSIWIQAGKIIDPHKFFWYQKRLPDVVLDAHGLLVVPGFIEAQINGAFGVDFSVPSDYDTYEKGLLKVNRGLLKYGTTSYCPTIVSSSASVYHKVLPHLKPRAGSAKTGATILGAHVEGPFINEARIGAHELKVLQPSASNGYKDFKNVYGLEGDTPEAQRKLTDEDLSSVKIITCAPELEGVMDAIPDLVKAGITVSVGHSMANTLQAEKSVMMGATFITHLFNAMPQFHHRDPGVIGLLGSRLDLPRPYYGLICDGIHVHPNSVKIAYDSHPEGVILVTDAMSAMGLSPGNYQLGNMNVTKDEDRVYIKDTDTLAGRASVDTHTYIHTSNHALQLNDQDPDDSIGHAATDNKTRIKHHHYGGFLPTPPSSTPMSPLHSASGSSTDDHYLSSSPPMFHTVLDAIMGPDGWTVCATHYEKYEEYHVYDHCEEHHGSDHSLQILTLYMTEEDDDDADETATIVNAELPDIAAPSKFDQEESGYKSIPLIAVVNEHDRHGSIPNHTINYTQTTTLKNTGSRDFQPEMSDCGCRHGGVESESEGEGESESNSGCGSNSSQKGGSIKPATPRTDVNADGDLCCPSSSVITLDACVRNFIQFTSCSIIEALEAVTLHPAVLLGIQETKGIIKPGADADLIFLSDDLYVKRVFVAGEEVDLNAIDVQTMEKF
ncbi:hypothetical protein BG011_004650 [Mortierella polycephala]|uniref:N-acetylglucosamine-6-phosphate deacetylase n=1 Tax=Mortierella polycephala TaxID=41804 RepID=A0A9P6PZ93_9FUNG|nr:hypothetical protein BG011_004650 [Mortierella polycephala]